MHSITRVSVEPGLSLCQKTFGRQNLQLFDPVSIEKQASFILSAISQLDARRCSKLFMFQNSSTYSSPSHRWKPIEVQIDVISTQTMRLLPQADKSNYNYNSCETEGNKFFVDVPERSRYRCFSPGLEREATDILAFTDPAVEQILSSDDKTNALWNDILSNNADSETTLFCGTLAVCPGQMLATLGKDSRRCNEVGEMREYLLCALTHSMLHLFGYDHKTMEQRDEMIAMEKKVARCVVEWLK